MGASSPQQTSDGPSGGEGLRVIGGLASTAIVAGSMLGIGIFLAPPVVARHLPGLLPFFGAWLLGATVALSGATAYAELGAMLPRAGGDYVFHREAFGGSVAFATGWVLFGAVFAGSIAAISVPLCEFQLSTLVEAGAAALGWPGAGRALFEPLLGLAAGASWLPTGNQLVALGVVVGLTALNAAGARVSARTQLVATLVPVLLLSAGALYAIVLGAPVGGSPAPPVAGAGEGAGSGAGGLDGWVTAFLAVYFAYSGWNALVYVSGEVRRPGRTIPRALAGATVLVTALYLLLCVGFLSVLGFSGLQGAGEAGSATARALGGDGARLLVAATVGLALLASINGTVLGGARIAYAMARGGALPSGLGRLNRAGVPGRALWLQAAWAGALVLTGTFETLLQLVAVAMLVCGSTTVASLFVLRVRSPEAARPYRATGYPALPALYLVCSLAVVGSLVHRAVAGTGLEDRYPLVGLAVMLAAWAWHAVRRRRWRQTSA